MSESSNRWDPDSRPTASEDKVRNTPVASEQSSTDPRMEPRLQKNPDTVDTHGSAAPLSCSYDEASDELCAIVGSGSAFHGTLSFSGSVRIDGEFSGNAHGGERLIVGQGARISGELRAREVIILGGEVHADIVATEIIELYIPAQVHGDLRSPQIYMDRGIQFQGTCDMTGISETET